MAAGTWESWQLSSPVCCGRPERPALRDQYGKFAFPVCSFVRIITFDLGGLPTAVVDKTKAGISGRLILRVDCDKGKFAASITVDGTPQPNAFTCGDTWQEKFLTDIRKGQQVVIHAEGDEGTQFAMELVIRQDTDKS